MSTTQHLVTLGRRVFGVVKRPLWQAIYSLTRRRTQARTEYLDFGWFGGYFEAESKSVQQRLPPGFEVIENRTGATELEIWCAEYRRMDILKPYNELGIIVPVRFVREGEPPLMAGFVLQMPVTSEEARWGGVDNYGFPKIVADIAISDDGRSKLCRVWHRGVYVLGLRVDAQDVQPFEQDAILLNVRDDHRIIEARFEMTGSRGIATAAGGVSLELGTHAIADELRLMGLRTTSGRGLFVPQASGTLHKGIDLGLLPARREVPASRTTAAPGNGARAAAT